jgi:hypothetical protein
VTPTGGEQFRVIYNFMNLLLKYVGKKARRRLVGFTVTISTTVKIDIADFSIIVHPSLNIYCFLIHFYIKKQQTFRNTLLTP